MADLISRFTSLPGYGLGGLFVLLLYAVESEIRFGSRARTGRAGPSDHSSTLIVSLSASVPVLGFVLAMKSSAVDPATWLPHWFRTAALPGLPAVAWTGVLLGVVGLGLRLWALLTLRERYTRTLLVQDNHLIERGRPYQWIRHPGYLGSLLCLDGVALASGNWVALLASVAATSAAYSYRIKIGRRHARPLVWKSVRRLSTRRGSGTTVVSPAPMTIVAGRLPPRTPRTDSSILANPLRPSPAICVQ